MSLWSSWVLLRVFVEQNPKYVASQEFPSMTAARRYVKLALNKRAVVVEDREGWVAAIPWERVVWLDIIRIRHSGDG